MAERGRIGLPGVRADTLVGFMAGLGTLRLLAGHWPGDDVRLAWDAVWPHAAVLHADRPLGEAAVLDALEAALAAEAPVLRLPGDADATFPARALAGRMAEAVRAGPGGRLCGDLLRALASPGSVRDPDGPADRSPFVMLGAGQTNFLSAARALIDRTTRAHLQRTLFAAWDYADADLDSLRWDPEDGREHAYTLYDPSQPAAWKGNLFRRMAGANRLALTALPCFPTVPGARRRQAVGVAQRDGRTRFVWPVWTAPCTPATARALLGRAAAAAGEPDGIAALRAMGVVAVLGAERSAAGRYPTVLPAEPAA